MADEYLFDISNHNDPVIDWARVVAPDNVPGGWLKLTQATDFVDGLADDYVAQAKGSGVLLGGYHFGDHRYDAAAQARFFFDRAAALGLLDSGDLAPMYDVENWTRASWPGRTTIRHHVNIWLDEAVRRGCKRALVYGSLSWWFGKMLVPEDYQRDDIEVLNWIAVYNGRPGDLQGWAHPRDALHQYTSDGTFDGIDGRVDKNRTLNGRTSAGLTIGGESMSEKMIRDALSAWVKNDLTGEAPGDQREILQKLVAETKIKVQPDGTDADGKPLPAWEDQLGAVIAAIDRRLVRVEQKAVADIDEDALAEGLEKRGVGGANVAQVKAAVADVLGRVTLTPAEEPK